MCTHLFHLELDGRSDVLHFAQHRLVVTDGGGELASLGQTRTQDTGDQLDQRFRGKESVILLG